MSLTQPKFLTPKTLKPTGGDITWSPGGITGGTGRASDAIDNSVTRARMGYLAVSFQSGGTMAAGTQLRFYLIRRDTSATPVQGGSALVTAGDGAVTVEPVSAPLIGVITSRNVASETLAEVFAIYDPGPAFQVVVWDGSAVALASTFSATWTAVQDETT